MTRNRRTRFDHEEYERRAYPRLGGKYASEIEISDIVKLSGRAPTVLEIGTGTGRIFQRLVAQNSYTVGVDPDVSMAEHTANRLNSLTEEKPAEYDLVAADGEYLPFKNGVFGLVVCVRVLRYFNRPKKAVEDMCRVLSPKGRLVLEFANILRPQTLLQIPQYLLEGEFYPRLFRRKEVEEWVSRLDMHIEHVIAWHKLPVELLGLTNNQSFVRALIAVESTLQSISPPEFMSRSIVLSAIKSVAVTDRACCNR